MKMELKHEDKLGKEFYCEISELLSNQPGFKEFPCAKHYLQTCKFDKNYLAIRRPGRTVGSVKISDDGKIEDCWIEEYTISDYPRGINDELKKFVGETIEL